MHIAVDHGAEEGLQFVAYVSHLVAEGIVPARSEAWLDRVRTAGNRATHRTEQVAEVDAKVLVDFLAHVLRVVYEMPSRLSR